MPRLLFSKTGDAIWMSHLDLMRLMQRAFKRAGLALTHTQGYNPRPSVSIALPLSVGVESRCELLDFDLDGEMPGCEEITARLNAVLVPGIRVLQAFTDGRKIKDLALLDCRITLEYDKGVAEDAVSRLEALFQRESLIVEKKGKNGPTDQDIIPMIRRMEIAQADGHTLVIQSLICCQNPSLNPTQLIAAIERYLPSLQPDHAICRREEIYDQNEKIFR